MGTITKPINDAVPWIMKVGSLAWELPIGSEMAANKRSISKSKKGRAKPIPMIGPIARNEPNEINNIDTKGWLYFVVKIIVF